MPPEYEIEDITDQPDYESALAEMLGQHDSDGDAMLVTVLEFLKRNTRVFEVGDPRMVAIEAMKKAGIKKRAAAKPAVAQRAKASDTPKVVAVPGIDLDAVKLCKGLACRCHRF